MPPIPIEASKTDTHWPYSREAWFALALRQRWWRETEFDRREAPAELMAQVATELARAIRGAP